jgi:hypothetical protein
MADPKPLIALTLTLVTVLRDKLISRIPALGDR